VSRLAEVLAAHELQYGPAVAQICPCGFLRFAMPDDGLLTQQDHHRAHVEQEVVDWIAERLGDPAVNQAVARAITALTADVPWRAQTPREHAEAATEAVMVALGVPA